PAAPGGASIPALLTRIDGVSISSSTCWREARSVTSARRMPSPSRTSMPTTVAPSAASALVQTGPRFPSAPVTTAPPPRRPSARIVAELAGSGGLGQRRRVALGAFCLRQELLEVLEGQRGVLGERVAEHAANHVVELVRRQPVAGRLQRQVLGAEDVPGGKRG